MRRFRLLSAFLLTLVSVSVSASDWPQFLGPNRDNTSPDKVAPWTGTLKAAWKQPVGDAHSSPVVADGVVYAFAQPRGKNVDSLAAFEAKSGKQLWEKSYERGEFHPPFGDGPRGTPSITAGKVYTLGGTGILACWDAKTGAVIWKVDTLADFQAPNLNFGISASPLVAGGKVFVNVGGKGAELVAFDAATGKLAWKTPNTLQKAGAALGGFAATGTVAWKVHDSASYASPIAVETSGVKQIVFLTAAGLASVDPETGKEYWYYRFKDLLQESATTPLAAGNLLIGSSVTLGSVALKMEGNDGKPTVSQVWKSGALNCYFSTPVLAGEDDLYMLNGKLSINPSITLRCVSLANGKVKWEKPNVGKYHAAIIRTADSRLLMFDDAGVLTLFAADPKEYKQLAQSKVCGSTWAHPALAGGMVFVRDEKYLYGIPLK